MSVSIGTCGTDLPSCDMTGSSGFRSCTTAVLLRRPLTWGGACFPNRRAPEPRSLWHFARLIYGAQDGILKYPRALRSHWCQMLLLNSDGTCEYKNAAAPTSAHASLQTVGFLPFVIERELDGTEHPGKCAAIAHARALARCPREEEHVLVSSQEIIAAAEPTPHGPTGIACYSAPDGLSTFHGWQHMHWIEGNTPRLYVFNQKPRQ